MMSRSLVALALFFGFASESISCSITWNTASDLVRKVMDASDGFTFEDYDAVCEKLEKANAALDFTGEATVLSERSIAWARVSLRDKDLYIGTGDYSGMSTSADEDVSRDKAEEMLFEAINDAIAETDFDKAIASLDEARQAAKAALGKAALGKGKK